jgi:UDP-3-O-[3-hydroxymyristoyl] glucosamine N-acyltransferase
VGEEAVLGADCELQANAVVAHRCVLGDRVLLKPGAVIGADGFGFRQDERGRSHKIPQVGVVVLGDDVEVGANTTIDRARFDATRIGRGCKIDAQVHIGHNVIMGEDCLLAGHVGVAGSCRIGSRVMMGGMSGAGGDVVIADDTKVAGMTMVRESTEQGAFIGGIPGRPHLQWAREMAALRWLPELVARHRRERKADQGDA